MLSCDLILFKTRTPKSCCWMTIIEVINLNTMFFTKRYHNSKQLILTIFSQILNKSFCWMNQKQNINNIPRLFLQGLTKHVYYPHNLFHQMHDKYKIKRLQVIVRTITIRMLRFVFASFAKKIKTIQVASYILIKLQIELKCYLGQGIIF